MLFHRHLTVLVLLVVTFLSYVAAADEAAPPRRFNFENDIVPILSRYGCNSSGCHGKAEGQNGFKLSVFGFDPSADYAALTMEARGRRVFPAAPEHSLLLAKASGRCSKDVLHSGEPSRRAKGRQLRSSSGRWLFVTI